MFEGIQRHWSVLRDSWAIESEERKSRKKYDDTDFLPAALEILEKPASPVGRTIIWLIIAFFAIGMGWSYFGKIDIVATAMGRVIPKERVKIIQPIDTGVVRAIHVEDGQRVRAGDILIELDPTFSGADEEQVKAALRMARMNAARGEALLSHLISGDARYEPPEGAPSAMIHMQERLIDSQIREYEASHAALTQQRREREAEYASIEQEIQRLEQILPLINEQVEARRELMEKGLNPRLVFLQLVERQVDTEKQIDIQKQQYQRAMAAIDGSGEQIIRLTQEFRRNALADLADASAEAMVQEQELLKATQRNSLQKLTAPIDGIVQQLAIHTIGGVVQPAEALMVIVPGEGELIVEAMLLNKDIGFVHIGDPVEVKLEAFPFTKYGVIDGILEDLSSDAIQDENLGLVYQARVSLAKYTVKVRDKEVNISPGMVATAEIKTGKRRLIEFLLSPLLRYKDESLRER